MIVLFSEALIDLMDVRDESWPDMGGTSSMYEDALDENDSEVELEEICAATRKALSTRGVNRPRTKPLNLSPPVPATYSKQASSSSDHSSIEKIQPVPMRRSHQQRSRKSKSAASSRGDSDEARHYQPHFVYPSGDWHLYPVLLQLSQTLQAMSSQLHDMETANRLQLRIVYRVLRIMLKLKEDSSNRWFPKWLVNSFKWTLFILVWPLLARFIWVWYSRRRHFIAKAIMTYL
ncbi:unnamed protein product, partial [Mesorhabditis spiculigera]